MATPKFLQFHSLHSYYAAMLNADDTGEAKKMPYGGSVRGRVASQCLKYHWRNADDNFAIERVDPDLQATRSRETVSLQVIRPLRESGDYSETLLDGIEEAFNVGVYGASGADRKKRQSLLLGHPEVEFLQNQAIAICDEYGEDVDEAVKAARDLFSGSADNPQRANLRAFREVTAIPGGLAAALFGRMVTSDFASDIEAPVHVAHSVTTHEEESENDYFSSVDDLWDPGENGGARSSYIGDAELTSGLYYGYAVINVPGLVSNLAGCRPDEWLSADRVLAATVAHNFIRLIATVSPGAKRGATAPYAYADLLLVEAGDAQPRSLATAFRTEQSASVPVAIEMLAGRLRNLDESYGAEEARRFLSVEPAQVPGATRLPLRDLADWAASAVQLGEAV